MPYHRPGVFRVKPRTEELRGLRGSRDRMVPLCLILLAPIARKSNFPLEQFKLMAGGINSISPSLNVNFLLALTQQATRHDLSIISP